MTSAPETEGFDVGDAELGGGVDFEADFPAVGYAGEVGGDDGVNPGGPGRIEGLPHLGKVSVVEGNVEGEVGSDAVIPAYSHDFRQVFYGKVAGGAGAHVQPAHAEIHRIGTALDGSVQAVETTRRRHYFQLFPVHDKLFLWRIWHILQ